MLSLNQIKLKRIPTLHENARKFTRLVDVKCHHGLQRCLRSSSLAKELGINLDAYGYKSLYEFRIVPSATPVAMDISAN